MKRNRVSFLALISLMLGVNTGCHDTPAVARGKANAARLSKLNATPPPPPLIIKPVETPVGPNAPWQPLAQSDGELDLSTATLDFSPRSAVWRFTLTSDATPQATAKTGQDHSYLRVNMWIADKDPQGKIIMRPVPTDFKRKAGAGCVQEFENGLWPDGSPRAFQIGISGTYVIYHAKVEDLPQK